MYKKNLNFIFWGTPELAKKTLDILKESGYLPSLIITALDKPKGRKMLLTPPPVKLWAIENNIQYAQPKNEEELYIIFKNITQFNKSSTSINQDRNIYNLKKNMELELSIVVAYGKIIPKEILNIPKLGSINIHYSLLPKYRGASPVESAILNGEKETGVSIQQMEYKMDSGPILAQEKTDILSNEKTSELKNRLIKLGGNLLVNNLENIINKKIISTPQNNITVSFCKKIKKNDGLIDLNDNGIKNYNKFRAYNVWPKTFFFKNGKRIIITDAELLDNQFVIKKIIPEGKKETNYKN